MSARGGLTPWEESFRRFFRLAKPDWTPPKVIRVRTTRSGMILKAAFVTPEGGVARINVFLSKRRLSGEYVIYDEGLKISQRRAVQGGQP